MVAVRRYGLDMSAATAVELASLDGIVTDAAAATIPATDAGFLRGDGAFEVIRVYDGKPFALADHLDRLEHSARGLMLDAVPRGELESEVAEIVSRRGGTEFDGCLRVVLTREQHRLVLTEPVPGRPGPLRLSAVTYAPSRILDGIKSLSYAANMLASRIARERRFDEALLVTPHGRVLEAPTASIFWIDGDGTVCTPPLAERILASITRQRIMEVVEVSERTVTLDELGEAAEVLLASTTREVQPVSAVDDASFPELGDRTAVVAARLRERIAAELG